MKRRRRRPAFIPLDTSLEAYEAQIEAYRRLGSAGRSAVMFRLSDSVRRTTLAGIRSRHPDYTEERARMALFRLLLGDEQFRAVWPSRELVDP